EDSGSGGACLLRRARDACACCRCRAAESFLKGDIAADDSFEMAVIGAEQQRAIGVERFGAAVQGPFADLNRDAAAERGAAGLPLIGDGDELVFADALVIAVEFAQERGREIGAAKGV